MDFGPNQNSITDKEIIFAFPHQVYSVTAQIPGLTFDTNVKLLPGFSSVTGARFIVPSVADAESYTYKISIKAVLWFQALGNDGVYYLIPGKLMQYGNIAEGVNNRPISINGIVLDDTLTPEYTEIKYGKQVNTIEIPSIAMRGGINLSDLQSTAVFTPDVLAPDFEPYLGINTTVTLIKKNGIN